MVHANAVLTPRGRLLLARLIVDEGWPVVRAAEHFHVSWPTAKRWANRYAAMGAAGMTDRSSRPHHSPNRTPQQLVRKIVHLRWRHRLSPLAIASRLSMPASTVYAVLVRCRLNRLSHIDARTGELIRRYEHDHPGSLIHVDVKKLGNIPSGGGWRFVGRSQGKKNRHLTPGSVAADTASRCWDTPSSTPLSMTTPEWPTPRSTMTNRLLPRWPSSTGRSPGSPLAGSPLKQSCRTTAAATAHTRGVTHVTTWASNTAEPAPTGRRQTEKSSVSTAAWPPNGPSPASIPTSQRGDQRCQPGYTPTITTGNTQQSGRSHPSQG